MKTTQKRHSSEVRVEQVAKKNYQTIKLGIGWHAAQQQYGGQHRIQIYLGHCVHLVL